MSYAASPPARSRKGAGSFPRLVAGFFTSLVLASSIPHIAAQVPGKNVNLVAGDTWPDGDPFLQRQNEPSVAVSSRNILHLLAGGNDYRTVDLPGLPSTKPSGDAWLGVFKSTDGGQTWKSSLLPGYPQDISGVPTPLRGFDAGADATVRTGSNGLFYFSGIVFQRAVPVATNSAIGDEDAREKREREEEIGPPNESRNEKARLRRQAKEQKERAERRKKEKKEKKTTIRAVPELEEKEEEEQSGSTTGSAVFVSTFIDLNNQEAGDPIRYVRTSLVDSDSGVRFLDKQWTAVDIPRGNSSTCSFNVQQEDGSVVNQQFPGGRVYVAYTAFTGPESAGKAQLLLKYSTDCGLTWSASRDISTIPDPDPNDDGIVNTADLSMVQASYGKKCGDAGFNPFVDSNKDCIVNLTDLTFVSKAVGKPFSTLRRVPQGASLAIHPLTGAVSIAWREFRTGGLPDVIQFARSTDFGATFSMPITISALNPFDQGTSVASFRTTAYPTIVADASRLYVAWASRGYAVPRNSPTDGDARIVISTSTNGTSWTAPRLAKPEPPGGVLGHQIMPAMTFGAGKLSLLYYDFREDVSGFFEKFVDETPILNPPAPPAPQNPLRHTMDVWLAQADPSPQPTFSAIRLSEYAFGVPPGATAPEQITFNPPNLPMFRQGAVPFIGDYIDLAMSPTIKQDDTGAWVFNIDPSTNPSGFAVWTDNRNVRPGPLGNLVDYTPPNSASRGTTSISVPGEPLPQCIPAQTGTRNQDIFGARFDSGLFATAIGNAKPLDPTVQRAFALLIENSTPDPHSYRLTIVDQPVGGQASFRQFGPALTELVMTIPRFSTAARTLYATSSDPKARILVNVSEIDAFGQPIVVGGLRSSILINGDSTNPAIENPAIENPAIENKDIQAVEIYNPRINPAIENPAIENSAIRTPAIENPAIENVSIANKAIITPAIENPAIENPAIENSAILAPAIENPAIENFSLANGSISDTTWELTNDGNTAAVYAVKLLLNQAVPDGIFTQLVVHKMYTTPAADPNCELKVQLHSNVVVNITSPAFAAQNPAAPAIENPAIENPAIENSAVDDATVALAPGETAFVTVRVFDPDKTDQKKFEPAAAVTPAVVAQSVNTEDVAAGIIEPPVAVSTTIAVPELDDAIFLSGNYGQQLYASVPGTWSIVAGALPLGVSLAPTGVFSGVPTTPGTYSFTVQFTTTSVPVQSVRRSFTVTIAEPLAFATSSLPDGVTGFGYSAGVNAVGGVGLKTWAITAGALPSGLALDPARGRIFGTPNASGTFPFTIQVTDSANPAPATVSASFTIVVADPAGFERVWNGVNSNWSDPANWIPNGVPAATDDVLLVGPANVVLTQNVAVHDLSLVNGATLDTSGFTIVASGNVQAGDTITGAGTLMLTGSGATLSGTVSNLHIAAGASVTLTGPVHVTGDFIHEGGLLLAGFALDVDGTLIVPSGLPITPRVVGAGAVVTIGGLDVASLVLDNAPLVLNDGQFVRFDNVRFQSFPPQVTPLTIAHTGEAVPWTFNGLTFIGEPTTGNYIVATDSIVDANTLTIHMVGATAANGPSHTAEVNGALVNWATAIADLEITKSDSADPIAVNGTLTYTIGVTNHGPDTAVSVQVVDALPATVSFVSASAGCTPAGGTVTCALGDLVSGASTGVTITVQPTANAVLTNTANVFSSTADDDLSNNQAVELTTVTPAVTQADLRVTKTHGPPVPAVGQSLSYSVTVTNNGPNAAHNVSLIDTLPAEVDFVSVDNAACQHLGGQVTCSFPTLNNGAGITVSIVVTPTSAAFITNSVNVGADETDPVPGNNLAQDSVLVSAFAPCAYPTVAGPTFYPVGVPNVVNIATGDFNEDDKPDAAVTESTTNAVVIMLGDGAGGFSASSSVPVGATPQGVVVADFNEDGDADIAVANSGATTMSLLLGNGLGAFTATTISLPIAPFNVVRADFNSDTHVDLVASSNAGSTIAVLLGDGAGGFSAPTAITVGTQPVSVVAHDFDGNGTVDIAAPDLGTSTIKILSGNGLGGFAAPITVASFSGTFLQRLRDLGDVNGDGRFDLGAQTAPAGAQASLYLVLNSASGFLAPVEIAHQIGAGVTGTGDFNGDAKLDLAVVAAATSSVNVMLGDGSGGFTLNASLLIGTSQNALRVVDLNGDSRLDIVGTRPGHGTIYSILNVCGTGATADLEITKSGPATAAVGTNVTYTIAVTNHGPDPSTPAVVTDVIPAGMSPVSIAACTNTAGTLSCPVGPIAPNASVSFNVTLLANAQGTHVNRVMVIAQDQDPNKANNGATSATVATAAPLTFLVTNTNDSGPGSLRQALLDSNLNVGSTNTIAFNIQPAGAKSIALLTALPTITTPVVIDGLTQGGVGYTGPPLVELNGNATTSGDGLTITAGGSLVRGLVINRFKAAAISLSTVGGNNVQGNYIGTNAAGTVALPNTGEGVAIGSSSNNTVTGNLISGNGGAGVRIGASQAPFIATGNVISGNTIGTDVTGGVAVGNLAGVGIGTAASGNTVGGLTSSTRNLISGNNTSGVVLAGAAINNVIQGNYVGTDVTGTAMVANKAAGISVSGAGTTGNVIGGTASGAGNVISGNGSGGLHGVGIDVNTSAAGTLVQGNFIGTDVTGALALPNANGGVQINNSNNNTIGGTTASARNVISGNGSTTGLAGDAAEGVNILGTSTGNQILGNRIGTTANGLAALPNATSGSFTAGVAISASGNTIGGTQAGAGNLVSGNGTATSYAIGIWLQNGSGSNQVLGNFVGTNAAGTVALPNTGDAVRIDSSNNNTIGGPAVGAGNVLAGNGAFGSFASGIAFVNTGSNNTVQGNKIGTDVTGTLPLGNSAVGVFVNSTGANNVVGGTAAGAGNTIAFNSFDGVGLTAGTGVSVRGNAIFSNGANGIDLDPNGPTANDAGDGDTGANNLQNFPVLTQAVAGSTIVVGTLNSTANTAFALDFFASATCDVSGFGEGQRYLGSGTATTDATGNVGFQFTLSGASAAGEVVTATATDPNGNTSEFSACQPVIPAASPILNGNVVETTYLYPNLSTVLIPPVNALVGGGLELTNYGSFVDIDFSDTRILITARRNAGVNNVAFDGLRFADVNGTIPAFTGVTVNPATNYAGFTQSRVTFDANTIFVNLANLPGLNGQSIRLDLQSTGADLSVTKSHAPATPAVGQPLTYTVTVTNNGPSVATSVSLVDTLPASVSFVSTNNGACANNSGTVTCNFASLAAGASIAVDIVVTPNASEFVTNTAVVSSATADGVAANNTATDSVLVLPLAPCSTQAWVGPTYIAVNPGASTSLVFAADFNGDGKIDAAVTSGSLAQVDILLGDGLGGFAAPVAVPVVGIPNSLYVTDVNNDSRPDLLVAIGTNVHVLLRDAAGGAGAFTAAPGSPFATSVTGFGIGKGLFNADSNVDIAIGSTSGSVVGVLLGNGNGSFGAVTTYPSGQNPVNVVVRDFNHDSNDDIAIPNQGVSTISVLSGNGLGGFSAPVATTIPGVTVARLRDIGDVNADGWADLAVTTNLGGLTMLPNNQAGGFTPPFTTILPGVAVGFAPPAVDVDGDGHTDLVVGASNDGRFYVLYGDGTGAFPRQDGLLIGIGLNNHEIVDLNGDSRPDIIATRFGTVPGSIVVLLNVCGTSDTAELSVSQTGPATAAAGDQLTYSVTVTNNGPMPATGVVLTDVPSPGMSFVNASVACTDQVNAVTCPLGSILSGGSVTVDIHVLAFATGSRFNFAQAIGQEFDPDFTNNLSSVATTVAAAPVTFVVTSTNDAGAGSLRQAITNSNANAGSSNTITFNIPGAGVKTIQPLTALPNLTVQTLIDGTTQPGWATGAPVIELNGALAGTSIGLNLNTGSGGSTIRGLIINGFGSTGLNINSANNVIVGNFIGVDATGTVARPNAIGIGVNASNTTIGGTTPGSGNLVASNSSHGIQFNFGGSGGQVYGNLIGTNSAGAALGNGGIGIHVINTSDVLIGDGTAAGRNVIASNGINGTVNTTDGVLINASTTSITGTRIAGNYIGLTPDGTTARPNYIGIGFTRSGAFTIGNTVIDRNVISGNAQQGINVPSGATGTTITGNVIGLNATGTAALANVSSGIAVAGPNTVIGGTTAGSGNVIAGNTANGINFNAGAAGSQVLGNIIGTNANGANGLGNGGGTATAGVSINNVSNITVGSLPGPGVGSGRNIIVKSVTIGVNINAPSASVTGIQVVNNYIGTANGTTPLANGSVGVRLNPSNGFTITNTLIDHNLISGNTSQGIDIGNSAASGTVITANTIGLNAAGTAKLANGSQGVFTAGPNTTIGGTTAGSANTIAGNGTTGVSLDPGATGSQVLGNFIGTNANGDGLLGNASDGVRITSVSNITIGGPAGARNVISGNGSNGTVAGSQGVFVNASTASISGIQIVNNYLGVTPAGSAAVGNYIGIGFTSTGAFTASGTVIDQNVVAGNTQFGINLGNIGATGTVITSNVIGLNAAATMKIANGSGGIFVPGPNTMIGGGTAPSANVIAGNTGPGISLQPGATGSLVLGNFVGTNATGAAGLGNSTDGVRIDGSGTVVGGTAAGAGNTITGNGGAGVLVATPSATGNAIRSNHISSNVGIGIDLGGGGSTPNDVGDADVGPNNFQNFPVITSASVGSAMVGGTLNSTANTLFGLDFFANTTCDASGFGEGQRYLGSGTVTTDGAGNASFNFTLAGTFAGGEFVTATATDPNGNTSELSSCSTQVAGAPNLAVTTARAPASPLIGSPITYTLTVTNNGTAPATNVTLVDTLPSTAAFMSASNPGCVNASGVVTCTLGTIANGASTIFNIVAQPIAAQSITNSVTVGAAEPDANSADNVSQDTVLVAAYGMCTAATFSGPVNYATGGSTPQGLVTGHFNADGFVDVIATELNDNTVAVMLGNGTGAYASVTHVPAGTSPSGIVKGDFNEDSDLDIIVSSSTTTNLYRLLGNEDGTFAAAVPIPLPFTPFQVTAADLNHDNHLDLVVTRPGSLNATAVAVLLGDGSGGFGAVTNFTAGTKPSNVVFGDFNGDTHLDIAVPNEGTATISILSGTGTGSFSAPVQVTVGGSVERVRQIDDVNGDNKPDLAVTTSINGAEDNNSLYLLLNNGSGGFLAPVELVGPVDAFFAVAGDLNKDGKRDLVALSPEMQQVLVLHGDGAGGFGPATTYNAGEVRSSSELADLNNDGRLDIVGTAGEEASVFVMLNTCASPDIADVSVSATGPTSGAAGDPATYTLTVTNNGPAVATGIVLIPNATDGYEFIAADDCAQAAAFTCEAASLAVGASKDFTFQLRLYGGTQMAWGTATAQQADPDFSNNYASITTVVTPGPLTFVVTNTSNNYQPGSLNYAIEQSNNNDTGGTSTNTISFNIGAPGSSQTIAPQSPIEGISNPVVIDAWTQGGPGYTGPPLIVLNGASVPQFNSGLYINAPNTTVRGFVINGFANGGAGIYVDANASGAVIQGNYIGTNAAGSALVANQSGVIINAPNATVGGASAAQRNVISGNSGTGLSIGVALTNGNSLPVIATGHDTLVLGNYIGLNAAGTVAIPNNLGVLVSVPNVTLGTTAAGNVISGNTTQGVILNSGTVFGSATPISTPTNALIQNNRIGTNAAGTAAIANNNGVQVLAGNARIGGTAANTGNLISGNVGNGISLSFQSVNIASVNTYVGRADGVVIEGNTIGLFVGGTTGASNSPGIRVGAPNATIGGTAPGAGNVIAGNGPGTAGGVVVQRSLLNGTNVSDGNGTQILGNFIGIDAAGTAGLGNSGPGVAITDVSNVKVGSVGAGRNVIAGNTHATNNVQGVSVSASNVPVTQIEITGNYIGVAPNGSTARGNKSNGVNLSQSGAGTLSGTKVDGNTISGNGSHGLNFSGNVTGTIVTGNFIGTNATGTAAVANANNGIQLNGTGATIGGTTAAARNVISGNGTSTTAGVGISSFSGGSGNTIQGNYIGTNAAGDAALPNADGGIGLNPSNNNIIGGTSAGARNIISGNGAFGKFAIALGLGSGATGNTVQGNYIGLAVDGVTKLGNSGSGISLGGPSNTIGGSVAGAGNVISGNGLVSNSAAGIFLAGNTNIVAGNLIGTDAAGAAAVGNAGNGIDMGGSGNTIGGTTALARNVISGNGFGLATVANGIAVQNGATTNQILGNYIGVNAAGTAAVPNSAVGVYVIGAGNTIGSETAGGGNVISGNGIAPNAGYGVNLQGPSGSNTVKGNRIGTDAAGTAAIGNLNGGVFIGGSSNNNIIGSTVAGGGNTVAFNGGVGVTVSSGAGNAIRGNSIFSNTGTGVDLGNNGATSNDAGDGDAGANNLQNFPVLTAASTGSTTIDGTFDGAASTLIAVDFFAGATCDAGGFGEGQRYLGSTSFTTDGGGNASFSVSLGAISTVGEFVTATATDAAGNTSEFSACLTAAAATTGQIAGHVADLSTNQGVSGVPVRIHNSGGTLVTTSTTDIFGNYQTIALTPGNYFVATDSTQYFNLLHSNLPWVSGSPVVNGTPVPVVNGGLTSIDFVLPPLFEGGGPIGAQVQKVIVDPVQPSVIYIGTLGGVYKSTDSAATWHTASFNLAGSGVNALAMDPANRFVLYAGTVNGVSKTVNGGGSWSTMNTGLTSLTIQSLLVDPSDSSRVFVGTSSQGIYRSTNGAANWSAANTGLPAGAEGAALAADASGVLYMSTGGSGVYKSTDHGDTWVLANSGLGSNNVLALLVDPSNANTIYAASAAGGVHQSVNAGGTWTTVNTGLTSTSVRAIAVDPSTPTTIYAATFGGMFKSTNSGGNWSAANSGFTGGGFSVAVDPSNSSIVYAGSNTDGVFKSTNSAGVWSVANTNLTAGQVVALAINPLSTSTLYAANQNGAVAKSSDSGDHWASANSGFTTFVATSVAINPTTPATLYVGTNGPTVKTVFKSTDSAGTWTSTGLAPGTGVAAVVVDPVTPTTVYAGLLGQGVYRSVNSGGSWTSASSGMTNQVVQVLAIDPTTPNTLYAGTNLGLFKTTNQGGSWSSINVGLTSLDVRAIAVDSATPQTLYAGTANGLFKSVDGGANWTLSSTGITSTPTITSIAINPSNHSYLLAARPGLNRVFRSLDAGQTWTNVSSGLPPFPLTPTSVTFDPIAPSIVYLTTSGAGVFRSADGGVTWVPDGPTPAAAIVATDASAGEPSNPAVFQISRGPGSATTFDRELPVSLAGSATNGIDYNLTGAGIVENSGGAFIVVRIPAGQQSITITATPIDDSIVEGNETVTLTADGQSATATITDDDVSGSGAASAKKKKS